MSWYQFVTGSNPLKYIFEETPVLENVKVTRVKLDESGPELSVFIELNEFPEKRPNRWPELDNCVEVELQFFPLLKLQITGWERNNIVDFHFQDIKGEHDEPIWDGHFSYMSEEDRIAQRGTIPEVSLTIKGDSTNITFIFAEFSIRTVNHHYNAPLSEDNTSK